MCLLYNKKLKKPKTTSTAENKNNNIAQYKKVRFNKIILDTL